MFLFAMPPDNLAGVEQPFLHIPDGFLSVTVSLVCWAITAVILAVAIRRTEGEFAERQIPLMGVMAAFIFAAQMINFPVAGGTSGHMVGGALAAITLGPWAGMLAMTAVIGVQALLFQDGGLLAMGANILNMGLVTAVIGYGFYRAVQGRSTAARLSAAGGAAWLSVMAGALFTGLQLWLSGTSPLTLVMPAMLSVHAVIGLGEALITVAALAFILRTRPGLLGLPGKPHGGRGWVVAGGLVTAVVLALAPLASANPDGLEWVAEELGFMEAGLDAPYEILPDYTVPFLGETAVSVILAGIIGALIVAVVIFLLVKAIQRRASAV
jgi:cobalt/nickel transport system permease protein